MRTRRFIRYFIISIGVMISLESYVFSGPPIVQIAPPNQQIIPTQATQGTATQGTATQGTATQGKATQGTATPNTLNMPVPSSIPNLSQNTTNAPGTNPSNPLPANVQQSNQQFLSHTSSCSTCNSNANAPKSTGPIRRVFRKVFIDIPRNAIDSHNCGPHGCGNPIGCGNVATDLTFLFGTCRQFFGNNYSAPRIPLVHTPGYVPPGGAGNITNQP